MSDWFRDPRPAPELADLVLLARLHENIVKGKADGLPRIDEVPAFAKFHFGGIFPDSSLKLLHAEQAAVMEVMRLLGADR